MIDLSTQENNAKGKIFFDGINMTLVIETIGNKPSNIKTGAPVVLKKFLMLEDLFLDIESELKELNFMEPSQYQEFGLRLEKNILNYKERLLFNPEEVFDGSLFNLKSRVKIVFCKNLFTFEILNGKNTSFIFTYEKPRELMKWLEDSQYVISDYHQKIKNLENLLAL